MNPIVMGKKSRKKRERKAAEGQSPVPVATWFEKDGMNAMIPEEATSPEMLAELTKKYQQSIRESPMWDEMVEKFGKEMAEQLLSECKAELK